ncbi:MAG: hypothetical protein FJ027_21905 [Candidatus Rokubacteria bacterium]|nr:hypothetical protein [Candidatus Rokubacteria bacterium]
MPLENLAYALTQVLHNFGAVAVVGGPAFTLWAPALPPARERALAWLVALGWAVQIASGTSFGAVSYFYYGRLPDIHGIAVVALTIKVACAAGGLTLATVRLLRGEGWSEARHRFTWRVLAALGATALAAAAFLRWFL